MKNAIQETTEWEDLQVKHGNWAPREKPDPPPKWTPEEEQEKVKTRQDKTRRNETKHNTTQGRSRPRPRQFVQPVRFYRRRVQSKLVHCSGVEGTT